MDVVAIRRPKEYRQSLTRNGAYIPIGHAHYDSSKRRLLGDMPYFIGILLRMMLDPEKRKKMKPIPKRQPLEIFSRMLETGSVVRTLQRPIPLKTFRKQCAA